MRFLIGSALVSIAIVSLYDHDMLARIIRLPSCLTASQASLPSLSMLPHATSRGIVSYLHHFLSFSLESFVYIDKVGSISSIVIAFPCHSCHPSINQCHTSQPPPSTQAQTCLYDFIDMIHAMNKSEQRVSSR